MSSHTENDPGSRRRRRSRRSRKSRWQFLKSGKFQAAAISTVAALTIGVILLVYAPRLYHNWRESRLLQRASALLQQGDYRQASSLANQALLIEPNSISAFYILAEATEKQNLAETVAWRAQIARLLPRDLDSQLNLASAALRFGQLDAATRALDNVTPEDRNKAAYHVVAGWLARAHGSETEQLRHFAQAVEQEPDNDVYKYNLAQIEINSTDGKRRDEARHTLRTLSGVTAFRSGSLRALLSDAIRRDDMTAAEQFAQDLQLSPQVTFSDYLLCLDFYRKLDSKKALVLLEKVKGVAERNPADLALLMDWMVRAEMSDDVIFWMEKLKPELTNLPPASISVADAFVELKNWSRLRRWTRSGAWGESEFLRLAYQAFAARQARLAGSDAEFDALWHSAEDSAADRPEQLARLARLATRWNLNSEGERLWLRVARQLSLRREALDALRQVYRARNDLPNLYRIAQRLFELSPNEAPLAAEYARLGLILDKNPQEAHRIAHEAYEREPTDVSAAVTQAFSYYALGRTNEGLQTLRKLRTEQLHDPHAAVFAALLFVDGNQPEAAREYIGYAQHGPIYPEEKRLLEEAILRLNSSPSASATPAARLSPVASPAPAATPKPSP